MGKGIKPTFVTNTVSMCSFSLLSSLPPDFSSFLDMGKSKKGESMEKEVTLVKAAAWAWYQHGSGAEGRPAREFDVNRAQRTPSSSRFRQEVIKSASLPSSSIQYEGAAPDQKDKEATTTLSPETTENSLLDSYEIEKISQHFDHLLEPPQDSDRDWPKNSRYKIPRREKAKRRGPSIKFWQKHVPAMCSSSRDTIVAATHVPRTTGGKAHTCGKIEAMPH
ncbi:hypothetical protein AMTRI_Chr04g248220 [Amborella trichopoda]